MTPEHLRRVLNDSIRWIETRQALAGGAEVIGGDHGNKPDAIVLHREWQMLTVIGQPPREAITEAAAAASEIIAFPENYFLAGSAVPEWFGELVTLFDLPSDERLAEPTEGVAILSPEDIAALEIADAMLRAELDEAAARDATIFAAIDSGVPVSFCYDASMTETLWDIGIDTVEGHRGQGHAFRCASAAIRHWLERGRSPRWASAESNFASRRLARKLGFRPADAMVIFEPE